jgi:hypothetical protein
VEGLSVLVCANCFVLFLVFMDDTDVTIGEDLVTGTGVLFVVGTVTFIFGAAGAGVINRLTGC